MIIYEKADCIFIDDPRDESFVRMAWRNSCDQVGITKREIQLRLEPIGFLGLKGERVGFTLYSYKAAGKANRAITRFYERIYQSRGESHNLHVLFPDEKKSIPVQATISKSERHKLESKNL